MMKLIFEGRKLIIENVEEVVVKQKGKTTRYVPVKGKETPTKNLIVSSKHHRIDTKKEKKKHMEEKAKSLDKKEVPYYRILGKPLLNYTLDTFENIGTEEVDDAEIEEVIKIMVEAFPLVRKCASPEEIKEDIKGVLKGVKL